MYLYKDCHVFEKVTFNTKVVRKNKNQLCFVYFCLSFIIKRRCVKFQVSAFIAKKNKNKYNLKNTKKNKTLNIVSSSLINHESIK